MISLRSVLTLALALAVTLGNFPNLIAQEYGYPSTLSREEIQKLIDGREVGHPRLLTDGEQLADLSKSLQSVPLGPETARGIVRQAEAMLDVPPIKREKQGRRLLGQSRLCVRRVLTLAMAFHLTGNDKFAKRAEKEMLAVADFTDWNPSHFLDVGEMTFALAMGYDWLFHELPSPSRKKIRMAIVEKGVQLPFTTRHKGWVRSQNNWGQVCHGGLTAGALAVMEDHPELAAKTVHNALQNVRYSMDAYAPNGSYPEGPGYWSYGTSYNVLLIASLESALGSDFGLTKAPGFALTGQYPALVCGPSGQFFNYADGGSGRGTDPTLYWFAKRFDRPDWLLGEQERLKRTLELANSRSGSSSGGRLLPLLLLWMDTPLKSNAIRMPLHWSSEGHVPVTVHRSSWTDPNATFVGLKGGSPSANHGQMDIGSFVLDADGVRWAMDLGAEGYHGIESRGMNLWSRRQDSDRWTIFRQCNAGHNTLVIDGRLQHAAGFAPITDFSAGPALPHSITDMSDVYQDQVKSARRGVALLPSGQVMIRDELTGLKPGAVVRWGMITRGEPDAAGEARMQLRQQDKQFTVQIVAPSTARWQRVDTANPRNPWDSRNRGTHGIAFECTAPPLGELTFVVSWHSRQLPAASADGSLSTAAGELA